MQLVILGTAGYHPNDHRHTACILLPELGLMFDAGTATYRLPKYLRTNTLDIFLSHAHLDHVVGLTFLLDVLYIRPLDRVTVHGDGKKLRSLERHLFHDDLFPVKPAFDWLPLRRAPRHIGSARVTHFPLAHPGGCLGYRVDWPDRSLAYVTDTTAGPEAAYVSAIAGVDVLIHECNFRDENEELARVSGHSVTSEVARIAARAGVGRLLLVHFNPLAEQTDPVELHVAREIFPATELAHDELTVEF